TAEWLGERFTSIAGGLGRDPDARVGDVDLPAGGERTRKRGRQGSTGSTRSSSTSATPTPRPISTRGGSGSGPSRGRGPRPGRRAVADAGLEAGRRDRQSYAVSQGAIRLIFTSPLESGGAIAEHTAVHGDSVRDVALRVDDAKAVFGRCVAAGMQPVEEPHEL